MYFVSDNDEFTAFLIGMIVGLSLLLGLVFIKENQIDNANELLVEELISNNTLKISEITNEFETCVDGCFMATSKQFPRYISGDCYVYCKALRYKE